MTRVPVYMYHHVRPHNDDTMTVSLDVFERQMRYLAERNIATLSCEELIRFIRGKGNAISKSVVITFDDGWLDNYYYAYPILRKYNINATFFLVSDWVEQASLATEEATIAIPTHNEGLELVGTGRPHLAVMNWKMAREMSESGLFEFQSHTHSHPNCTELDGESLEKELNASKTMIEARTGRPCTCVAWPWGQHNETTISRARLTGYEGTFTSYEGTHSPGDDPMKARRMEVRDNVEWFKRSIRINTRSVLSTPYYFEKKVRWKVTRLLNSKQ